MGMRAYFRERFTARMVALLLLVLAGALTAMGFTLVLSWQLEGSAAVINDVGSLRMYTKSITLEAERLGRGGPQPSFAAAAGLMADIGSFDLTLARVLAGDPSRPLILPDQPEVRAHADTLSKVWHDVRADLLASVQAGRPLEMPGLHVSLSAVLDQLGALIGSIERFNANTTRRLRNFQLALIAGAISGTVVLIYLFYLWGVAPLLRLQTGIARMAERDFSMRLPVERVDEFGALASAYNRMADKLDEAYGVLERRVHEKTVSLEIRNRELRCLYEIAAYLNEPYPLDILCQGVAQRLATYFNADAVACRLRLGDARKTRLVAGYGFPEEHFETEHPTVQCGCAQMMVSQPMICAIKEQPGMLQPCHSAGFVTVCSFPVWVGKRQLGALTLHFRRERSLDAQESKLLETLGRHLGVALEHRSLRERQRELAVLEERNLMAQGLHDSVAQTLNYLGLQVQMLQSSLQQGRHDEVASIVPLLQEGVVQCYADVRELLHNFRVTLPQGDMGAALGMVLDRFRQQTGLSVSYRETGVPVMLKAEQRLHLLFIAQEALSNVRRHARADNVVVELDYGPPFILKVSDDGIGWNSECQSQGDSVGLQIMRERAERIAADLVIQSKPGAGTKVCLQLSPRAAQTEAVTPVGAHMVYSESP